VPGRELAEFRCCYGFLGLGELAPPAKTTSGPGELSNEHPGQDQVLGDLTALTGGPATSAVTELEEVTRFELKSSRPGLIPLGTATAGPS
jgi:hypothetical protein